MLIGFYWIVAKIGHHCIMSIGNDRIMLIRNYWIVSLIRKSRIMSIGNGRVMLLGKDAFPAARATNAWVNAVGMGSGIYNTYPSPTRRRKR